MSGEGERALNFPILTRAHLPFPIRYCEDEQAVAVSVGIVRSVGLDVSTHGS